MTAKRPSSSAHSSGSLLPIVAIAAGIALTLWMSSLSQSNISFSDDSRAKVLLTQQIAQQLQSANLPLDVSLNVPAADWIKSTGQAGSYPFSSTPTYEIGAQRFIAPPFVSPLINAPFYALLGDGGLYIIPLAALWLTWLRFWQIGKRAAWGVTPLCLGLVALIFASPLSFYSGMYWEHTLAVALAFWGVSGLIFPKRKVFEKGIVSLSRAQALGSAVLIGLSVWFRPEFLCLAVAVSLLAAIGCIFPKWRLAPAFTLTKACILMGGMVCTIGILLALNYGIYGYPFGIDIASVAGDVSRSTQLSQSKASYLQTSRQMLTALRLYFPIVWIVGLAAIFTPELQKPTVKANLLKRNQLKGEKGKYFEKVGIRRTLSSTLMPSRFAIALSLLFALGVPLLLPESTDGRPWGLQFHLILVPLLSLVLAEQLRVDFFRNWSRKLLLLGTAIAIVIGINLNSTKLITADLNTINRTVSSHQNDSTISLWANDKCPTCKVEPES